MIRVAATNTVSTDHFEISPDDLAALSACLMQHLQVSQDCTCQLLRAYRKMKKLFVEFEVTAEEIAAEDSAGADLHHCIGKVYGRDCGQPHFDALLQLWKAGFRPPSLFTVVYPIAYVPDRYLLLAEKAPGRLASEILFRAPQAATDAIQRAAGWLVALHATSIDVPSRLDQVRTAVARYGHELAECLPEQAMRVESLTARVLEGLSPSQLTPLVPSHGDFHPEHVFITDYRVTAIDLDTFGGQERAADVAYFLGQTAIMGYFRLGSFAATTQARYRFLQAYLEAAPLQRSRLALYLGICFLQSLHYELCVWRTGNLLIAEPWLTNAERCLLDEEVTLMEEPKDQGRSPMWRSNLISIMGAGLAHCFSDLLEPIQYVWNLL
jgi:hypothetical protein